MQRVSVMCSPTWMIFIVIGPPNSAECAEALQIMDLTCACLGVLVAAHKRVGPATCLTYLGIKIDTVLFQLRLPQNKLLHLWDLLTE